MRSVSALWEYGPIIYYVGVPGNLFAFTCKLYWNKGYAGFVSFLSKTRRIERWLTIIMVGIYLKCGFHRNKYAAINALLFIAD